MIFKRKFKMKNSIHSLFAILIVLLCVIRTNCDQIDYRKDRQESNKNLITNYELDPSDILPGGVDLDKLMFIVENNHNRTKSEQDDQTSDEEDETDEFESLVSSGGKRPLSLESSTDNFKVQTYNQMPRIIFKDVFENDLTKKNRINSDDLLNERTFSDFYPDSEPINEANNFRAVSSSTFKLDNSNREQLNLNLQMNQKLRQHLSDQINQEISQQIAQQQDTQDLKAITQLDAKISLYDILSQLNIFMGSNSRNIQSRQRKIIRNNPGILSALNQGLKLSISECKYQFKDNYWNCPMNKKAKGREMFGNILDKACRETAFLTAIQSAGIAFAITKACTDGLIRTCSCDYRQNMNYMSSVPGQSLFSTNTQQAQLNSISNPSELALRLGIDGIGGNAINNVRQQEYTSDFKWSGCSDNIKFAFKKVKLLLDYHLKGSISSTHHKIMIHNYEAGRMAIKQNMMLVCKCHGVSGTCTMRTCWRRLSSFRKVGNHLKDQYNAAVHVIQTNDGQSFTPGEDNISPPSNQNLYYIDSSPDFCARNLQEGSLGTSGRQCNANTSSNPNSCDQLCCGRGYRKEVKIVKSSCNCRFEYCCEVKCDTCKKSVEVYECV